MKTFHLHLVKWYHPRAKCISIVGGIRHSLAGMIPDTRTGKDDAMHSLPNLLTSKRERFRWTITWKKICSRISVLYSIWILFVSTVYQYITSQRTPLNSLVDNHCECSIWHASTNLQGPNVIPEWLHRFCDARIKESIQRCGNACPTWRTSTRIISWRVLTRKDCHLVGNIVSKVINVVRLLPNELILSSCVSLVCPLLLLFLSSGEKSSSQRNHITRIKCCEQPTIEARNQTIEKSFVPIQCN